MLQFKINRCLPWDNLKIFSNNKCNLCNNNNSSNNNISNNNKINPTISYQVFTNSNYKFLSSNSNKIQSLNKTNRIRIFKKTYKF